MKMPLSAALTVLVLFVTAPSFILHGQGASPLAESTAEDLQRLQGTWQGVEAGRDGEGTCKMIVDGNTVRFEGGNKKEWYVGTLTLPAGKNPKQLYAAITECARPEFVGKTALGIYKLEDGALTLVGHPPGDAEAPKGFEGDATTRTFVLKKLDAGTEKPAGASRRIASPKPEPSNQLTVEQRFQEADVALAIAQYEKLQSAAFEIRLKLEVERPSDPRQAEEMARRQVMLRDRAEELRRETIRRGGASGQ